MMSAFYKFNTALKPEPVRRLKYLQEEVHGVQRRGQPTGWQRICSRIRCGGKARIYPLKSGRQVEGICYDTDGGLYISAENTLQKPTLFRLGRPLR